MTIFENHERLALHEPLFSKAGDFLFLTIKENDRVAIATTIERLIDKLDSMEPDPDLEPWIGDFLGGGTAHDDREADYQAAFGQAGFADDEPTMGSQNDYHGGGDQSRWGAAAANARTDECEKVSEDEGADIQSEPHDELDQGDREPWLGWSEKDSQGRECAEIALGQPVDTDETGCGSLIFTGEGEQIARDMLRGNRRTSLRRAGLTHVDRATLLIPGIVRIG